MWLPTPVYERIPQFFFLLGLLFFANGLYIGFEFSIAFVYVAFGMLCSAYGVGVFLVRMASRSKPVANAPAPESVPNTGELLAK